MRVAIQGEKGAFSHEAAIAMLGSDLTVLPCGLSADVFSQVEAGNADVAVIPIENSLAGSVLEHYDLLLAHQLRIRGEFLLRIRHCLVAAPGVRLDALREAYSHPIALAQCRRFFAEHPGLKPVPFYDTAGSVDQAVRKGGAIAGIGSEHAAREYGGEILLRGIEDNAANYTRFLLLRSPGASLDSSDATAGQAKPRQMGPNKVSLAFAVPNEPGSLVGALEIFARHGLNLTRLESRPVPGSPWEYVFYADYQLTATEAADRALAELRTRCRMVQEFGRYRAAQPLAQTAVALQSCS